jgi:hypothetical protein
MTDDSNTLKKAESVIDSLGLPVPGRPYDADVAEVLWPRNVADLSSTELAQHLTWWSAWSGYARYNLSRAETNHEAFSTEHRVQTQVKIMKSQADYKSVTELKASVAQLPEMQRLEARMLKAKAETKLLKALLENYEGKYKTVSREVSRRSADFEEEKSRYST